MQAIVETLFDAVYLIFVITIGILMIRGSKGNRQFQLFGSMAVVLGAGDSFHLVPRALALCTIGLENFIVPLGIGKWITSVTMTIFYVLLYYVWRQRYKVEGKGWLTAIVYGLASVRIVLCMMPQNQWLSAKAPLSWGIYRNIPFALMGFLMIVLFYRAELWVLHPGGIVGRRDSANWNADDSQNLCVCVVGAYWIFCYETRI